MALNHFFLKQFAGRRYQRTSQSGKNRENELANDSSYGAYPQAIAAQEFPIYVAGAIHQILVLRLSSFSNTECCMNRAWKINKSKKQSYEHLFVKCKLIYQKDRVSFQ